MTHWILKRLGCLLVFCWIGCSSVPQSPLDNDPSNQRNLLLRKFVLFAQNHPDRLWSSQINEKAKAAILDYRSLKKLPSQKFYGESVRSYDLRNKCASDIKTDLLQLGCIQKLDVLKNPQTNSPLLSPQGQTIPMIAFLCPDGGVVRLKPQGDPTSKFKPQPLASKSLRYPFDSKFENFEDEMVKIDNAGNAIPKWPRDLNPEISSPQEQPEWIQGWADDAHTDLKLDCKDQNS